MKNISRRVFIKGLAVAGVAAAASTVLAGCNTNMIPGVDDGNEDEGTETPTNQKVTLADNGAETEMTIEATGFQYVEDANMAIISVHVNNQLDNQVKFGNDTTANNYFLTAEFFAIDKLNNKTDITSNVDTSAQDGTNLLESSNKATIKASSSKDGKIFVKMPEAEDWEKLTVKVTLNRNYATAGGSPLAVAYGEFTFNK